jgi:catechol 2,3-dioxygenase-like lactoylglutathione lyase family enzyme
MINHGFNHVGLATHDMDATKAFYEDVLGFETVRYDRIDIEEGGFVRHIFMEADNGQIISFMEPNDVPNCSPTFDAGINAGLGLPNVFVHIAFEAGSEEGLETVRKHLEESGVKVTPVMDHDWCKSLYFNDPVNNISLEFCRVVREFTEDDRTYQFRFRAPAALLDLSAAGLAETEANRFAEIEEKSVTA